MNSLIKIGFAQNILSQIAAAVKVTTKDYDTMTYDDILEMYFDDYQGCNGMELSGPIIAKEGEEISNMIIVSGPEDK